MTAQTTTLDITGMSCANCSATIEDSLAELDGVSDVTANYATDEATVEYDDGAVSLADLYAAVEEAGYGAVSETTRIGIADMSCANCADTNAEALESLPGVIEADVNYATDEAQVRYNPAAATTDTFYDAIENAGYEPVREAGDDSGDTDARDAAREGEIRKQLRLTLFGAVLSAPLLVFLADRFLLGGALVPESVFGVELGWFPVVFDSDLPFFSLGMARQLVLPVVVLVTGTIAGIMRYSRAEALEYVEAEFVKTAKSKGADGYRILTRHVLRPAAVPLMTILVGDILGIFLAASYLVEVVFGIPGLGQLSYNAIIAQDTSLVLGTTLIFTFISVIGNLIQDVAYTVLDPRIDYGDS